MTYVVQHGSRDDPAEQNVATVAGAARIAIALVREKRRDVRIRLPSGDVLDFEAFQDAVFRGDLSDGRGAGEG